MILIAIGVLLIIILLKKTRITKVLKNISAFGILSLLQMYSVDQIVKAFEKYGDGDPNKLAYILATAWHESRLKPIKEIRAKSGVTRTRQDKYWPSGYYGRGFVQLTWKYNYAKMSKIVGVDLVKYPDKALNVPISAKILVYGMMNGTFTGKALGDYINSRQVDFYMARKIVNGLDRAQLIQSHAQKLV
ncbi:MAG: glycoside hydrolase family 19 protein [Bacteroidota bacterium]